MGSLVGDWGGPFLRFVIHQFKFSLSVVFKTRPSVADVFKEEEEQ